MAEKLLKVAEAAELLNLSEYQTLVYCREGIIPHVRCGRQIRFDPAAIRKWITEGGAGYAGGWKKEA